MRRIHAESGESRRIRPNRRAPDTSLRNVEMWKVSPRAPRRGHRGHFSLTPWWTGPEVSPLPRGHSGTPSVRRKEVGATLLELVPLRPVHPEELDGLADAPARRVEGGLDPLGVERILPRPHAEHEVVRLDRIV